MSRADWMNVLGWAMAIFVGFAILLGFGFFSGCGCSYDPISNNSTWREKQARTNKLGRPNP